MPEQHLLPCPFCGAPAHSIRATKHAEDCYFLADERLRNAKNADLSGVPAVLRGWNKRHIPADQVLVPRQLLNALLDGDSNVSQVAAQELRTLLKDSPE